MKTNSLSVIQYLLKYLKIKITKTSLVKELQKHPNDLSLLAISDTLSHWHIANAAYRIGIYNLPALPLPFIAHVSSNGGEFVLIEKIGDHFVTVSNEHFKNYQIDKVQFEKEYTGNVLVAEASPEAGEKDYKKKREEEIISDLRLPFILSGIVIVFLLTAWTHTFTIIAPTWREITLIMIKICGVITSILLLIHSVDDHNPFIQRLCTGGRGSNCNSILSSKAAKITSFLSWSEVGFFYFTGSLLSFLFEGNNVIPSLAVINLLCLPYTIYSIWYQFFVVKQWCPLCCTVQALLWLEFLILSPYLYSDIFFLSSLTTILVIGFSLPVLSWSLLKPWIMKSRETQSIKQQLKRFKYNIELFRKLLLDQPRQEVPDAANSVMLGNPDAEKVITVVSNPYCQPCSKAHIALEQCLDGRQDVKLQIVFSTSNEEKDRTTKVVAHIMTLFKQHDMNRAKKALDDWYSQKQKDYEGWAKTYPIGVEAEEVKNSLAIQKEWCKKAEVRGTPTIFINGYRLPDLYLPEDVRYFI